MDNFRSQGLFCDVTLESEDGKCFDAHRLILAAASPYFRAMFQTEMLECSQNHITLRGIDSKSLETLINYAYNGEVKTDMEDILDLLSAANMLCFEEVEKTCIDFLCKNMNITNCIDICAVAESLNCDELCRMAEIYVTKNFRWLVRNSKFHTLTLNQLNSVISSEKLRVASETEVYQAVITWVKYKDVERKCHLPGLLKHVRLTAMTRKYLVDIIMREPLVMDDHECRMLVLETLDHFLLPERRKATGSILPMPRKAQGQSLFVVGGKGEGDRRALSSVELYDFVDESWAHLPPLQTARRNVAVVALEGILYAIGGIDQNSKDLASVERFNFDACRWENAASLSHCRGALAATVVDGWIYAVGGSISNAALKHAERYDPVTDQWTSVPKMRLQRSHFGLASLDGKIYAIGGFCGISEVEHCEYLDPASLKWHEITCMNKSRRNHAVATHNDRIYAIGGSNCMIGSLNSIEKYNPDLNMWLVIKSSFSVCPGLVVCHCLREEEAEELLLVGGYDSESKEHNEIRTLRVKSPDYEIKKISEMKRKRAFAGAIVL
eukprot:gene12271-2913_t